MPSKVLIKGQKIQPALIIAGDITNGTLSTGKIANTTGLTGDILALNATLPKILDGSIGAVHIAPSALDPLLVTIQFAIPGGGVQYNIFNANAPFAFRIAFAWVTGTAVAALGTAQIDNGVNPISDAIACAAIGTTTGCATLDDATWGIAAGGTVRVLTNAVGVAGVVTLLAQKTP